MKKPDPLFETLINNSLRELDKKYSYFHFRNIHQLENFDKESLLIFCKACYFCLQRENITNDEFLICTDILNNSYEENKKCRFLDYENIYKNFDELIAFWITKALESLEDKNKIKQKDYPDLDIFNVCLIRKIRFFFLKLIPDCTNFLPFLTNKNLVIFYRIIYKSPEIIKNDLIKRLKNIRDFRLQNQIQKLINKRKNDLEIDNVLFGLILSYIIPNDVSEKIIDFLFKKLNLVCFINFDPARIVQILKNKNFDLEFKTYLLQEKIDPKFYLRKVILDFILEFDVFNSLEFRKKVIEYLFDAIWDFVAQKKKSSENSRTNYENNYKKKEKCLKNSINNLNIDNENNKKDINNINDCINNLSIQNNKDNEILFLNRVSNCIRNPLERIEILLQLQKKVHLKILFNFINELNIDIEMTKKYLERNLKNKISNMKEYFLNFKIEDDRVKELESSDNINDENLLCLKVTDKFEIPSFVFHNLNLSNFLDLLNYLSPRITLITQNRSIFEYGNEKVIKILDKKCFKDTDKDCLFFSKYPEEIKNENEIKECIQYIKEDWELVYSLDLFKQVIKNKFKNVRRDWRFLYGMGIYKQGIKNKFKTPLIDLYRIEDKFTITNIEYNLCYDDSCILKKLLSIVFENVKSEFILNKNKKKDCLIHKNCDLKKIISGFYKKNKFFIFWSNFINYICIFCIPLSILKRYGKYIRFSDRQLKLVGNFDILNKILIFKKMKKNVEILEKNDILTLFLNLKDFYSLEVLKKIHHNVKNNNTEYNNDFIELLKDIYFLIKNAPKLNVSDNEDEYKLFLSEIDRVNENIIFMRKKINQEYKICKIEKLNLDPFFDRKLIRVLRLNNSLQENHDISNEDKKYIFKNNTKNYKLFHNKENNEFNYEKFKELIYNHYLEHHTKQNLHPNEKISCKYYDSFLNTPFKKNKFFKTLMLISDTNFEEFISKYNFKDLGLFKEAFQTIYSKNSSKKDSLLFENQVSKSIEDDIFFNRYYGCKIIKNELISYFSYLIEDIASKKYKNMKINCKKLPDFYIMKLKYFIEKKSCNLNISIYLCPFRIFLLDFRECWLEEKYTHILANKCLSEIIDTYELLCMNYLNDLRDV